MLISFTFTCLLSSSFITPVVSFNMSPRSENSRFFLDFWVRKIAASSRAFSSSLCVILAWICSHMSWSFQAHSRCWLRLSTAVFVAAPRSYISAKLTDMTMFHFDGVAQAEPSFSNEISDFSLYGSVLMMCCAPAALIMETRERMVHVFISTVRRLNNW